MVLFRHPLHEKLEFLFDFFVLCFENDVVDNDAGDADDDAGELAFGDGVGAEQGYHQYDEGQKIGQYHGLGACRALQYQLHFFAMFKLLTVKTLRSDSLPSVVGGDADALGVAFAARRTDDDFHLDVVPVHGPDDAFFANGVIHDDDYYSNRVLNISSTLVMGMMRIW